MKKQWVIALVIAASMASVPVRAQTGGTDTLRLSLAEAIDMAEGGNPAYRQASNSALLNSVEMRTTWLDQILPTPSLSLFNTQFTGNLQRTSIDNFGNPIANPSADWVYFSNTSQNLNLSWRIQGQSIFQAYKRQSLVNENRVVAEERALTELQISIQRLYMDGIEQRELLATESQLVEARRIDLDVAERLFSLALRTRVDVLNAELAVEQQLLQRRQQRATYQRAVLSLRTALGGDELPPISLGDEPLPIFDPAGLDVDRLVDSALRMNPELRQARVAVRTAGLTVGEAQNDWWPSIDMGIDIYRRTQQPRGQSLFDVSFDEDLESRFYMQLNVPMFNNYFQNRQRQERAAVGLDNQRESERATRLRIQESVRGALLELSNQWETFRLSERSLEIASEALRLAREEYRIGTRTFEDLRSGFNQEADTRRQVITARHAFVDVLLGLEEAVGTRVRDLARPTGAGR